MAQNSKIEWTHHTGNLWWGCTKVHEGCDNCYAETLAKRTGSASSLIACESLGFDYIAFEIDPDYYAAAKKRMSNGIQMAIM